MVLCMCFSLTLFVFLWVVSGDDLHWS